MSDIILSSVSVDGIARSRGSFFISVIRADRFSLKTRSGLTVSPRKKWDFSPPWLGFLLVDCHPSEVPVAISGRESTALSVSVSAVFSTGERRLNEIAGRKIDHDETLQTVLPDSERMIEKL
jgi:hypothetical protein